MKTLIINRSEVRKLLPMNECIDVMAETFKILGIKETIQRQRMVYGSVAAEKGGRTGNDAGLPG